MDCKYCNMNIQLAGTVQNTGVFKLYISAQGDYCNMYDKQWGGFKELTGSRAIAMIAEYKQKMINYLTAGTKEHTLSLDSVLSGLYYTHF